MGFHIRSSDAQPSISYSREFNSYHASAGFPLARERRRGAPRTLERVAILCVMPHDLPSLPPRPEHGHKGTFGTVCVVGGRADEQRIMVGGPALSALAALRSGCGLAVLAVPTPIMAAALVIAPVATGLALPVDEGGSIKPSDAAQLLDRHMSQFQCIAVGPGLGTTTAVQQVVVRLIAQDQTPLVIDADALNCLAGLPDFHRDLRAQAVLTPHPGEYERLASALGIKHDPINPGTREIAAQDLARRLGCVVVLKGRHTIISDGLNTYINYTGNVALASGATGDVLTGMLAGFIAQFFKAPLGTGARQIGALQQGGMSLLDCARLAVHAHGLAADLWAELHGAAGMLATDLLNEIPAALRLIRGEIVSG
jgi:ADP-dependent NAD(P)H-hydrate dehydratase